MKRIRKALADRGESQADIDNIILDIHDFASHWDWYREPFLSMAEMEEYLITEVGLEPDYMDEIIKAVA